MVSDRLERLYQAAWTQALKSLDADVFCIAICGQGASQLSYDFMVESGVRKPRQFREVGDGLTDLVLKTKTPLLVGGFEQEQGPFPFSWMGAPLLAEEKVLGLISAQSAKSGAFERRDLSLLGLLAKWVSSELESVRQDHQIRQDTESFSVLLRFAKTLVEGTGPSDVLKAVAEVIPAVVDGVRCTVWSRAEATGKLVPVWRSDGGGTFAEKTDSLPPYLGGIPVIAQLITGRDVVVVPAMEQRQPDVVTDPARALYGRVGAMVPLVTEGEVVGLAVVSRLSDGLDLTPRDVGFLRGVADMAALALQRSPHPNCPVADRSESDEFKSRMLSTLSHEVRTPLSLISTGAELLMDKLDEPEKLRQMAELVNQGATRLESVVGDVVEYAELQTRPVVPCPQVTEIVKALQEAIDASVGDAGYRVVLEAPEQPISVRVDAEKLKAVVAKLVRNAVGFSDESTRVLVRVSAEPNALKVTVIDEGVGIPCEEMDGVFKPFFRGEASQTRGLPGTGLGLPIAKQLVEAIGGEITLRSQVNEGTTVTVSIPVAALA